MSWINKITKNYLKNLKLENNYRTFNKIENLQQPYSYYKGKKVINWSNNDYNNIIHNPNVKSTMVKSIYKNGCGSGGTRNISGSHLSHDLLEKKIAKFHNKESGLLFNSGYLANYTTIKSFGKLFPNAEIFSDKDNHASIINGINASKLKKHIFEHNNLNDLEKKLEKSKSPNKIIILESIYSMDGTVAPLDDLKIISKNYNTLTYIDEIHATGVYGNNGGGLSEYYNAQDNLDIIMGGFGKGFGVVGGYITGNHLLIDSIRSCGSGFIFTTAIPPHIADGISTSIDEVSKNIKTTQLDRDILIEYFKNTAGILNVPIIKNNFDKSHLQFIIIGNAELCKKISNILLYKYNHYVQHINYPTVPYNKERLRISLKSYHTKEMIYNFLYTFSNIYNKLLSQKI